LENLDGQRGGVGQRRQRGRYAGLGQHRGIDPVGEFPQLLQRASRLLDRFGERDLGRGVTVVPGAGAGEPDVVGQSQQALLGAIVEVSFEPAAFGIGGFDDAGPGRAKLFEPGKQFRLQALVLDAEPDRGPELAFEFGKGTGAAGWNMRDQNRPGTAREIGSTG
jgi:hypothetical protein